MQITIPIVTEAASWGENDPYVERIWMLTKEVIRHLDINEDIEDEADFAADRLYEKLITARNSYSKIADSDFRELNISQQNDEFEHLYSALWSAYKDRFAKLMKLIGYDVSFMFAKPEDFEPKATAFSELHPNKSWLVDYAKQLRDAWQNDLAKNRNAFQHDGDLRNITDLNDPQTAKEVFEVVCYVVEGVFAMLSEEKLEANWKIALLDDDETVFGRADRFTLRLYP